MDSGKGLYNNPECVMQKQQSQGFDDLRKGLSSFHEALIQQVPRRARGTPRKKLGNRDCTNRITMLSRTADLKP